MDDEKKVQGEFVTVEALLERGDLPITVNYIEFAQIAIAVKTTIARQRDRLSDLDEWLDRFMFKMDKAALKQRGLRIEKRQNNGRRQEDKK